MAVNLPTELLRSFVAIVETGSMLQATERVFVTQSALSLQMRRLEDLVRQPVFNRQGRRLKLTPAGEQLLRAARQILALNDQLLTVLQEEALSGTVRVGMNQDFAEAFLPGMLNEFALAHPETQLQVRIGGSQELLDLLAGGQLDNVLCICPESDARAVKTAPISWFGQPQLLEREVLPLALLEAPCLFRTTALQQLEAAGRPYRIVVETASLSGIRAAVQSGLAITCRSPLFAGQAPMPVLPVPPLPPLGRCSYALAGSSVTTPAAERLKGLIRQAVEALG